MVEARLRVHVVPVGFEVDRAIDPIRMLAADRVILLTPAEDDDARAYLRKIRKGLGAVVHTTMLCNTWDTNTVVGQVGAICSAYHGHDYFFNASTGPTPARIGGTIAGMLWSVTPYYMPVDYKADMSKRMSGDYPTAGRPKLVATFRVDALESDAVRALAFLATQPQPVSKWKLRKHLESLNVIRPKRPEKEDGTTSPQAFQAQTNVILDRLRARGFVVTTGKRAEFQITLTEKGQDGYKMYRHAVEPRLSVNILEG